MIQRTAMIAALLAALTFGFSTSTVFAEGKEATACEKKADKKKITDAKKRDAFIAKCEKKAAKQAK